MYVRDRKVGKRREDREGEQECVGRNRVLKGHGWRTMKPVSGLEPPQASGTTGLLTGRISEWTANDH